MFAVISAGVAPGVALLCYFYLKDQFESEPIGMVIRSFIIGSLLVFPIMVIQYAFQEEGLLTSSLAQAFIIAGFFEEFFKWFILYYTVYKHVKFSQHYDGIVYSVAISLGFASIENIFYLVAYGLEQALGRALLPVSSHALFGVLMGYYLGKAKFDQKGHRKGFWIGLSLFIPWLFHGTYDYILLSFHTNWIYIMIPFMVFLWWLALKKVKAANRVESLE
ncbi:glutamic-type intramembrane protease PrsW [Anaerobacillus sp. MEB173]|uniref:glutamic-type intramembrane protease PrsW n=1 Tax=Anaerobacillus sp. MEB173 TaxID=3383345 RepID=UPI003F90E4D3